MKFNLKIVLMELGNHLVQDHGFPPSNPAMARRTAEASPGTEMIAAFTTWLNACPEAVAWLERAGLVWPLSDQPGTDPFEAAPGYHHSGILIGMKVDPVDRVRVWLECVRRFGEKVTHEGAREVVSDWNAGHFGDDNDADPARADHPLLSDGQRIRRD